MIDSLFDRVIVISLPSNLERREHIRQHFAETGITNYEFFDAINGAELDLAALKRAGILADKPAEHGDTDLSPGEVGCAWSHISVYESALARRLKRILVCEDDVQFCAGANEVIAGYMAEMPRNWDIIHFMSTRPVGSGDKLDVNRKKITEHVYLGYNEGAGAACYALTSRCMKFLLRHAYPINKAADGLTNWPSGWWKQCQGYRGYIVTPLPATSGQFTTQIEGRPPAQGIQSYQTGVAVKYFVTAPAVDVVIVNWNYARFVADAIQSVKDQSYQNFRCIVVDNGSDDDSVDRIIQAIGNHSQFELHRLPTNLGHLGAALWSLERSTGEFITFLDADDVLFPNYLASHLETHLAAESPVGFTSSNCVDTNADGALLTSGNLNMHHFWSRGTPVLRPMDRTVRLTGVDDSAYLALARTVRYLPAHNVDWCWCPGSSNMFRRALLERIRPADPSSALFGGVDGFFLPILHALTGSILIDQPLSAHRLHDSNDFSMLPSLQGLSSEHPKIRTQSFNTYLRMLTWLVDHLENVVLMAGAERYWQIVAIASATSRHHARAAFTHPEFQTVLVRRYPRLVKLFGELRIFQELRRRLLFLEYVKIVLAARGHTFPIGELSRAFLREISGRGWLLYKKMNRSK